MPEVDFCFRWNGVLKQKKLYINAITIFKRNDGKLEWGRTQKMNSHFKFKNDGTQERRITTLENVYTVIGNNLIIGVSHNDKQMATVILTADSSDDNIICRVGHFTITGEFCEYVYDEAEYNEDSLSLRYIWGVDEYPEYMFGECC